MNAGTQTPGQVAVGNPVAIRSYESEFSVFIWLNLILGRLMLVKIHRMGWLAIIFVYASLNVSGSLQADDWNQWLGPDRNSVWNESGIITKIPADGLKEMWRTPVEKGFSGPAVANGRVFVTDFVLQEGDNAFDPGKRSQLKGQERIHCLDVKTGKPIWSREYDCQYNISYALGPRTTPTVDGDRVYTLGAEGQLMCLKVSNGETIWEKDLKKEYEIAEASIWGFAGHPLVHGDTLYCLVGGKGSCAVAFDKKSGEEKWRALDVDDTGYCPPTMIEAGGTEQLLIWHSKALNSLDPKTGEVYWSVELNPAYKMSIVAPIKHGDYLLVTALQGSSMLLELDNEKPGAKEIWRSKGLHPDHNPPIVVDNHIYGVDVKGRMRCIKLVEGKRIWESLATCPNGRPASSTTGFVVKNGDHYYITTEQGELIIAQMTPAGFTEKGRAKMVEPTASNWGREIVWSHPAFANKCVFMRNDKEIVCYSLAE